MMKKPKNAKHGRVKQRVSMWLSGDVLAAASRKASRAGISRTMLIDQVLRRDLGLPVGVVTDDPAEDVFA